MCDFLNISEIIENKREIPPTLILLLGHFSYHKKVDSTGSAPAVLMFIEHKQTSEKQTNHANMKERK